MAKAQEELAKLSKKSDEHEFYTAFPKGYKVGKTKYVVITGSVISGVGKGTFSSCLGNLLSLRHGLNVSPIKFDGYLNYDAGTLNPYRHGEVFVLDDGTECDLDLGTYERMMSKNLSNINYLTAGKIFKTIIDKERAGKYLGRDVQFIPHVTGEIKNFLRENSVKTKADIVLVEVGGTVGDLENSYFVEAMRELMYEEGRENVCFVNVVFILRPKALGEYKSKAAQLGLRTLMGLGIQPNIVICRSGGKIPDKVREKISIYSNVPMKRVINAFDISNIHEMPLFLENLELDTEILDILNLKTKGKTEEYKEWTKLVKQVAKAKKELSVGMIGKYTEVHDSYISIMKALEHCGAHVGANINIKWIDTTNVNSVGDAAKALKDVNGIIVPGGFGSRGTEGKIFCIQHARENNMPYLGLCYGFQMAVIEFARNVCGIKNADSTEIDPKAKEPVIDILPEQKKIEGLGGNMRLGGRDVEVKEGTKAFEMYGSKRVRERFRHRYEVNPDYIKKLEENGLVFSGKAPKYEIMQILELPTNKFHVGVQFHPEFTSKPLEPNPLYLEFLKNCVG